MTAEKLRDVCRFYRHWLEEKRGAKERQIDDQPTNYDHLAWMCGMVEDLLWEHTPEKSMRWLGFVQGVLVARGDFTLAELRLHISS